jgi:cvfA/B/C family virulence factor
VATYRILYWQEIPSQIRATDDLDEVTVQLHSRFMERIDQLAAQRGLQGTDDYLAQWHWSDEQEREGTAEDVARALERELEADADW